MSKQKHYEFITHEVTENILIGETMYCDVCRKEIEKGSGYWEVTTNEDEWSRDDADLVCFDVCSDVCLTIKFAEYTDRSMDRSSEDKYHSEYINVVREIYL